MPKKLPENVLNFLGEFLRKMYRYLIKSVSYKTSVFDTNF